MSTANTTSTGQESRDVNENTVVSTWLPGFVGMLKEAGQPGKPRLRSECGICHSMLDISTEVAQKTARADPRKSLEKFYEEENIEKAAVLPCGHVIGQKCLANWSTENKLCPFCRKNMTCTRCTEPLSVSCCPFEGHRLSSGHDPYSRIIRRVPLTLTEGDVENPWKHSFCVDCVLVKIAWLRSTTFSDSDACILCEDGSSHYKPDEPPEKHRVRRECAAELFYFDRLTTIVDLMLPPILMRDPEAAGLVRQGHDEFRKSMMDQMNKSQENNGLRRRIYRDCPFTGDTAGPFPKKGIRDIAEETMIISRLCYGMNLFDRDWVMGVDHLMGVTTDITAVFTLPDGF